MEQICRKCGKYAEGASYTIHHGIPIAESAQRIGESRRGVVSRSFRQAQQLYTRVTGESLFLCNRCVRTVGVNQTWLPLAAFLLLTVALGIFSPGSGRISLEKWVEGALLDLVILAGALSVLLRKKQSKGEDLAISLYRKETGSADTFWNSAQFAKLTPEDQT